MSIDDATKQQIRRRANYCCEYCHSPERISASRFTVEHMIPQSLGGSHDLINLALACRRCNERRYNFLAGLDPDTKTIVPLFNPRQQNWGEHFAWNADGSVIIGTSPVGRATCQRLDLNDDRYPIDDSIQSTRKLWTQLGVHPPTDDPQLPTP
jgi:hypothetical protein